MRCIGHAVGQKDVRPLPGGPVFSGGDLGFQADEPLGEIMKPGRRSISGKFVVNVNGRWVEARPDSAREVSAQEDFRAASWP